MKNSLILLVAFLSCFMLHAQERFPDGKLIPDWFKTQKSLSLQSLGKSYLITEYGVSTDSTMIQTQQLQQVIDIASENGGGVIVIPQGTFLSGSLFFKAGTHLYLAEGAVLKGSDDISNFPIVQTRMEGQTLSYFAALINAEGLDGFTISGKGLLDGNGLRYWKSFWLRRAVNPKCTNMDELRPRIVYLSHCTNAQIEGIRIANSPFWTTHFYKCSFVKLLNLRITSPSAPVKAPSSDAIDIDACNNVLIKNCYLSVNDDAIALKGGKGPYADQDENNGMNADIIIEDCTFGFCHGVLTCGSESVHNRNIIVRRCTVDKAKRFLWLKMRPDTPQQYEYISVDDIKGNAQYFLFVAPWTQFFDLKGREDIPLSYSNHITMRNVEFNCDVFFAVTPSDQYRLSDFLFENMTIRSKNTKVDESIIESFKMKNVKVVSADAL